jgi:hypothetical protein
MIPNYLYGSKVPISLNFGHLPEILDISITVTNYCMVEADGRP